MRVNSIFSQTIAAKKIKNKQCTPIKPDVFKKEEKEKRDGFYDSRCSRELRKQELPSQIPLF